MVNRENSFACVRVDVRTNEPRNDIIFETSRMEHLLAGDLEVDQFLDSNAQFHCRFDCIGFSQEAILCIVRNAFAVVCLDN
jgi:hypothetical protein